MASEEDTWRTEYSVEVEVGPAAVWALFRDPAGWKGWNAGVESVELEGPFADGTWFTMTVPGGERLRSRLIDVRENEGFIDETLLDDLRVTVAHRLTPLDGRRTRITYAVEANGPGAREIGPMVSADFPDVLASLATQVEGRRR
ncbi:MAG TPA: SRPBCC family protein [Polyangia bacterium]|nr:SRPBCC family protein [Polyangia bacterium]